MLFRCVNRCKATLASNARMSVVGVAPPMARRQKGVALISVLLVVSLGIVLTTQLLVQTSNNVAATSNELNSKQAFWYALGGEAMARQVLYSDWKKDVKSSRSDGLMDSWADDFQTFTIEEGAMQVKIFDLQGRFNINTLAAQDSKQASRHFVSLLAELKLSENLADLMLDWLDTDNIKRVNGAEDQAYLSQNPPYRSANGPIAAVSELLRVKGVDGELLATLAPHITVLPATDSRINVNTASKQLLTAVFGSNEKSAVREIINQRKRHKYTDLDQLPLSSIGGNSTNISVSSEFFEIQVAASYAGRWAYVRTVVRRDQQGEISIVSRTLGKLAVKKLLSDSLALTRGAL